MQECRTQDVWCGIRKGEQKARDWGVCIYACLGVDEFLGWKKFSNQWFLQDCCTNASCETQRLKKGDSEEGKFMEQILDAHGTTKMMHINALHHLSIAALKAGLSPNLIQSGQNYIELQHLGIEVKRTDVTFVFLLWISCAHCTEALFQARLITLIGCVKKYFMVKCPEKVRIVCSGLGKLNSTLKSMQTRSRSAQ